MRINRLPPALQAVLIAAAIEIPCAALLEKAGNDIHNAVQTILAILHMPTILFMLIVILPLKSYVVPDVLDSIWKIGAFLLQGMLIALLAFLVCLAPDFLDTELSVFMQRLQVQEAAGEPGLA